MIKTTRFILLILLFSVIVPNNISAENAKGYPFYNIEHGIELFNTNKIDAAVDCFGKILLSDFSNSTAKEYLGKIGKSTDLWQNGPKLKLLRFIELIDYAEFLESRIKYLKKNNELYLSFVQKNKKSDLTISNELTEIKVKIEAAPRLSNPFNKLQLKDIQFDVDEINENLVLQKHNLLNELTYLQDINTQLRGLKRRIAKNLKKSKDKKFVNEFTKQLKSVKAQLTKKDKNIAYFEKEIKAVRLESAHINEQIIKTDKKVVELTKELAGMSLELYEKDSLLGNKENRITTLEEELMDTKERLNLVQRIIREKDKHIHDIEQEVITIQDNVASGNLDSKNIDSLKADISDLNNRFKQEAKVNLSHIQTLEEQVQSLNKKYLVVEARILRKDIEISQLNQIILSKDSKLSNFKKVFSSKDKKLMELQGMLQIYKSKLTDTYHNLKDRDEKLKELHDKLFEIDNMVDAHAESTRKILYGKTIDVQNINFLTHKQIFENTKNKLNIIQDHLYQPRD